MYRTLIIIFLLFVGSPSYAGKFQFSFTWDGLFMCNTGNPNNVQNPEFILKNVPKGTKWIYFKMTDLDVPNYNHGGGWAKYDGGNKIKKGQFWYASPCPPSGSHMYEWTATATKKKSLSGTAVLRRASSSKRYP